MAEPIYLTPFILARLGLCDIVVAEEEEPYMNIPSNDSEIRFFGRYFIVWAVSRGVDALIVLITILGFEDNQLPTGWAIGLILDCFIDFFGQKLWVNKGTERHWSLLIRQFMGYLAIRCSFGVITGSIAWYYAGKTVNIKLILSYLLVSVVPWFFQLLFNRWLFRGTIKDVSSIAYQKLIAGWERVRSR